MRYGLALAAPTAADAPGLAALFASCGVAVEAPALVARLDALRADGGAVLLAHEWGPPSGIAAAHWHRTLVGPARCARLDLLLVAPDARGRGIGRLLVKGIAQAARVAACDTLALGVPIGAEALAAFAGATGFTPEAAEWMRPLRRSR